MSISSISNTQVPADIWGVTATSPFAQLTGTSTTTSPTSTSPAKPDSFRSDFATMLRAVQSGDIASAQSALTTLQSDLAASGATYSPSSTTTAAAGTASSPASDLDAMIQAVKSGDISGAQQSLAAFKNDVKSTASEAPRATGGHHHHHHHGGGGSSGSATSTSATSPSTSTSSPDSLFSTAGQDTSSTSTTALV